MLKSLLMPRVSWNGIDLSVDVVGSGPEVLLMLHGLGASRRCFEEAPSHLDTSRFTLVMPDLPGFGESLVPDNHGTSMASMASAMEAVVLSLNAREVHIVAHSMGGVVGLLLASAPSLQLRSFTSAEGNLVAEDALMSSKVSRLKESVFTRVWSKWLAMVEDSLGPEPVRQHELFLESLAATPPGVIHQSSVSCWALTSSGELADRFLALSCPKIYLVGEKTQEERPLPDPVIQAEIPVVTIPGVAHFVMENADAFYGAVRQFVIEL